MLPETRALGAAIAALNGALLLSFLLQYVRLFLLSDSNEQSLEDSYVARFLLNDIGWVLMAAAVVAIPLLLYLLLSGRRAYEPVEGPAYGPADTMSAAIAVAAQRPPERHMVEQPQALPPRVPVTTREQPAEFYKAEPPAAVRQPEPTRAVRVEQPRATADVSRKSDASNNIEDTDPHLTIPAAPPAERVVAEPAGSDLAPGYSRCKNCRAVLAPDTSVCPNCGTPR